MSEYDRTLQWLYALEAAKGMDFKLERVALALERLGEPQRRYPTLHVAGTNGKGSVAAMLHAVLGAAGHRVGLYTSPHLVELTERIRVGADDITREDLVALAAEIRRVVTSGGIDLTFFELVTVLAFLHFARSGVDVAVVEVGLGGRLDATNVIDPLVSIITTIGRDHTEWLGETLTAIAFEKGGIIKPGRPVVLGRIDGEAAAELRRVAGERGAPVVAAGVDYAVHPSAARAGAADGGEPFSFRGLGWQLDDLVLPLRGAHQRDNAGTAVAALATVRDRLRVDTDAVRAGLARVEWPGRLEVVVGAPLIVLDGAHNADGVTALARELPPLLGDRRLHLLFAVMADKQWRVMVERLVPLCSSVVVTEVLPPRGAAAKMVAEAFPAAIPVAVETNLERAWALVRRRANAADAILATGSLFLVGALRALGVGERVRRGAGSGALHP